MSARAVRRAATGRGPSRLVQSGVIFLVLLASAAATTVSMALLAVDTYAPFQHAFDARHGAHVVAGIDPARATAAQLAATRQLAGVSQAAGPFPTASATLSRRGGQLGTVTAAGRSSPGGPVDSLVLTKGRWARRPGEVVLASDLGEGPGRVVNLPLGTKITVTSAPGGPALTLVGIAQSITDSAGAWVVPSQIPALRTAAAPASAQMLYRFTRAGSAAQVRADVAAVTGALPAGAVAGTSSWLSSRASATANSSILAPFINAFAIMGLVMSALIVANVISGTVVAGYRRIGVLKSIGVTQAQVAAAYVTRAGIPALAGSLIGVALGQLIAGPVLGQSATVYGVGTQSIPLWVDIVTLLGLCGLTGLAALLPALRAGRLSATAAIATGQAPPPGRGHAAHRLLSRVALPRPVTIGLAAPFARRAQALVTMAAVLVGATAVIFAVGLDASLARASSGVSRAAPGQIHVITMNTQAFSSAQQRTAVSAIQAQRGTAHYVAEADPTIGVSGLTREVRALAFRGSAAWTGYDMVAGHWYRGAGEADVDTSFLTQTGLAVGDSVPVSVGGRPVTVRIVGEVFDPDNPTLFASWQTLGGAAAGLTVEQYDIGLRPGVRADQYASALQHGLGGQYDTAATGLSGFFAVATSLIAILTLMVAVVAGLGVLNTVLLGTRQRIHELGVFKAIGMAPRQTITMVLCWVAVPALAAALLALPAAILLHAATLRAMAHAAGTGLPASFSHVFPPATLALLALAGLVIAAVGALLPAAWAARSATVAALRAE